MLKLSTATPALQGMERLRRSIKMFAQNVGRQTFKKLCFSVVNMLIFFISCTPGEYFDIHTTTAIGYTSDRTVKLSAPDCELGLQLKSTFDVSFVSIILRNTALNKLLSIYCLLIGLKLH